MLSLAPPPNSSVTKGAEGHLQLCLEVATGGPDPAQELLGTLRQTSLCGSSLAFQRSNGNAVEKSGN